MSFTNFLENKVLDHIFGGVDYVRAATLYVGLSSTAPAEGGTNITEPAVGAYARVAVTNSATKFPAAALGAKANGEAVTFPTATLAWGAALTHFFIADALAGNILGSGLLAAPVTVLNGETVSFAPGDLAITLD